MSILLRRILKTLLIFLIPLVVVPGSARLLATDLYLAFEYGKASFPPDSYGFTPQQRFDIASANLHYVRAHLPGDALSSQTLNGKPVYNQREVAHMADVRGVFQSVLRVWEVALILVLILGVVLWQTGRRWTLADAAQSGGLLTVGLILSIALLAVFAWQAWFEAFHLFFFQPDSWLFAYSDTLIRLFPMPFWTDATFTISLLGLVGGSLLVLFGWQGKRVLAGKPT